MDQKDNHLFFFFDLYSFYILDYSTYNDSKLGSPKTLSIFLPHVSRGVIELSQYRAKHELDSIKNTRSSNLIRTNQPLFFFKCLKIDSKNSRGTRTRLDNLL